MVKDTKIYISYNQVHQLIKDAVERYQINEEFKPDLMIAIGGGGFIPARILRTFLKRANNKNIPIQAIGLSLYEDLFLPNPSNIHSNNSTSNSIKDDLANNDSLSTIGTQVIKTQWLHFGPSHATTTPLLGKNILIVDEVDDTRTTLAYAIQELTKDIEEEKRKFLQDNTENVDIKVPETKFAVFVLHNKKKEKKMELPDLSITKEGRYFAAKETPDRWLVYPWEANDIEEHTKKSLMQQKEELEEIQ
ncbi:3339_t:CDS:2 [Funneliformis geosporum]|uniref:544_t:CDS:1 n=1 Tax=Funneliformis geosporum TaxID=1117311 RepID=A0A9W4SR70_9GLOM|nr:3339_t:CDS:2 [Funneliformis geosporum]CAI2179824.1 544_t:CDS:2 [Funneliformis geosporum]